MEHLSGGNELSDDAIVEAVLNGRPGAYSILVRRYQDALYRHAERMVGRPDEAADIVQASFLKGYDNLERCHNPARFGAWLFSINANLCKDYLKNRRRRDVSLYEAGPLPTDSGDPEETAERGFLRRQIRQALNQLSPEEREAFIMKHVEGFSYQEMAERLDASVPALKMRVHRARENLQTLLEDYR